MSLHRALLFSIFGIALQLVAVTLCQAEQSSRFAKDASHTELMKALSWHAEHALGALSPNEYLVLDPSLPSNSALLREHKICGAELSSSLCSTLTPNYRSHIWKPNGQINSWRISPYSYSILKILDASPVSQEKHADLLVKFEWKATALSPFIEATKALSLTYEDNQRTSHSTDELSQKLGIVQTTSAIMQWSQFGYFLPLTIIPPRLISTANPGSE